MNEISANTITDFLSSFGWDSQLVNGTTIATWFVLESVAFDILIHLLEDWLQIEVPNLLTSVSADESKPLHDLLLDLNGKMVACKFSLEDDDSVSLSVDLPVAQLDLTAFSSSLELLLAYLERYSVQLFNSRITD